MPNEQLRERLRMLLLNDREPYEKAAIVAMAAVVASLQIYFSPWGDAKGEIWEEISGGRPFNTTTLADMLREQLEGIGFVIVGDEVDITHDRKMVVNVLNEIKKSKEKGDSTTQQTT